MNYSTDAIEHVISENQNLIENESRIDYIVSRLLEKIEGVEREKNIEPAEFRRSNSSQIKEIFKSIVKNEIVNVSNPQDYQKLEDTNDLVDLRHSYVKFSSNLENKNILIQEEPAFTCPICLVDFYKKNLEEKVFRMHNCNHSFCRDCVTKYLETKIIESDVLEILCMWGNSCNTQFNEGQIENLVSNEIFEKYKKFKNSREIDNDPTMCWCIRPDCPRFLKGNSDNPHLICECGQHMCFNCLNEWHEGESCENAVDKQLELLTRNALIKLCPVCKSKIEKNGGCNHMNCIRCHYQFCWICLKKYNSNHYAWWNLCGCPGMMYSNRFNDLKRNFGYYLHSFFYMLLVFLIILLSIPCAVVFSVIIAVSFGPCIFIGVFNKKIKCSENMCFCCILGLLLWPVLSFIMFFLILLMMLLMLFKF